MGGLEDGAAMLYEPLFERSDRSEWSALALNR